jgi:O-acetyl-ADP-ribose deacetylase (regulator of RNase III)
VARIELWNGDICDLEVDAIVSPASTSLWMSTGIAGELKRVGGDEIEFAAVRQGPAALGDAVVTPAGTLAARVVIHAVSLERDRRARELRLSSIAFPALGTGVGGFPLDEAARIAVEAVRDELASPSTIEHVVFALRGAAAYEAFAQALSAGVPVPSRPLLAVPASPPTGPVRDDRVGIGLGAGAGEETTGEPGG